ncbi:twin-arginine translocase subunit TatC [Halosquirtibacter xylanolyticus]|uniref:twin-arginine translocase subunit TatC n=1 Tax=Halosquirtibacter xylanolyticus TaxID=3374599 RepID=UPI00374A8733|nr:twin-arginine translocase subunit TatC [Prolixibacteraceae bacterium]
MKNMVAQKKLSGGKQVKEMSFIEHLEELRWHLVRACLSVLICSVVAFMNRSVIFDEIILWPKDPNFWTYEKLNQMMAWIHEQLPFIESSSFNIRPIEIQNIMMSGQFSTHIKVSIVMGFILAFPYVFYQVWGFVRPALYNTEKRVASGAVFVSSLLFIVGVLFGYFIILPLSLQFLAGYEVSSQVSNQIQLSSYIGTVTSIVFSGGVVFELPVIAFFFSKIGLLTPEFMRTYRKHSYVALLLLSAIITPPDVFSQVLVCIPLVFLYEVSIYISRAVNKKQKYDFDDDLEDLD